MKISKRAADLIIEFEVSSEATYRARYVHPEWPGGASGITIGIGYDVGYVSETELRLDWTGRLPDAVIDVLAARAVGLHGEAAHERLPQVRNLVSVPWEAAVAEFYEREVPKWEKRTVAALPNMDKLPPDCFGALVSLAYNRGTSFGLEGSRYAEMRQIKAAMAAGNFQAIPGYIAGMKRLWPGVRGLLDRRDREAALFRAGLAVSGLPPGAEPAAPTVQPAARAPAAPRAPAPPAPSTVPGPTWWQRLLAFFSRH